MYERTVLSNGLQIACETIPHVSSVALGLWVGTGSRYEEPSQNGISHLVEHMLFKGTSKRNAREIAETIDAVGGQLNAFTTKEYTCYYAKVLNQHYGLGIDLLAEMVTDSLIAAEELEKEKSVILEEIKSFEDSPDELIYDILADLLLKGHPLGKTILGTPETVARIRRETIFTYLKEHYTPENTVFAVAGNVQFDQIVPEIEKRLSNLEGNTKKQLPSIPPVKPGYFIKNKDIEQVHLTLGARGLNRNHADKFNVFVLDSILGGSVSSRLFQRLREDCGLVYATGSNHSAYRDTGIFSIYAATGVGSLKQVIRIIKEEVDRIQAEPVSVVELNRAKEQLKGNLLLSLENTSNRMSRLAKAQLFGEELLTPTESVARIEQVCSEDVQRLAREILGKNRLVMAVAGPSRVKGKFIKELYDEF